MMKKKKRVDAPHGMGQPEKKRKLNEMSGNKEDEEMVSVSKVGGNQDGNKPTEAGEESQDEVVFECLNCSGWECLSCVFNINENIGFIFTNKFNKLILI